MSKTWLEIVMPASLVLIFCTIMVFGLSMSGLLEPEPAVEAVSYCEGPRFTGDDEQSQKQVEARIASLTGAAAVTFATGDALFKGNCAQCHAVNDVVVGPALAGITKRRPMSWITAWVKNSSKMVARDDEYAVKIFTQYQKQQMPSFQLSDEEIKAIVFYIESHDYRVEASTTGVAAL